MQHAHGAAADTAPPAAKAACGQGERVVEVTFIIEKMQILKITSASLSLPKMIMSEGVSTLAVLTDTHLGDCVQAPGGSRLPRRGTED